MKIFKLKLTAILFLFSLPFSIMAGQLPSHYPNDFSNVGTIQSINISTGAIVVSDEKQQLSSSLKVNSLTTRSASKGNLNRGMNIGFSLGNESGMQTISEIWILPKNYFDD